ncbi:phosphoinositide 3-kinase regulatory subunit 6 [Syngnathus scovelli]|uniref:phosphoinositide 3-kinase regulatory subunit 6 n=1 Tax=Syngnathus scovelli TaxID=161590 RepID=UPI00210F301A|nr:phosphoinositide 3-kinase regulatory subunit 6 [Syngnathus scovelli]XP_049575898.1 phosphoinositide 3-kinase regulatory subunit 6 [Syngnathus scovelli]
MNCQALWDNTDRLFNMESKAGCFPTIPERELYRSIQAVLPRETDVRQSPDCHNKGILRWTLHKKVRNNPANSLSLLWVLIKELEKAERWDSLEYIIPLLHTLMYAIIQTAYIPDELYKRVYDFCKRLLTYPLPYCTIGLSYTRRIKMERSVPGLLYQRMVVAEQRLKNEHYPFQERIFVLADPEVFSASLAQVLLADIEAASSSSSEEHKRSVVQHSIQAALGEQCHASNLAKILKDIDVEPYFQDVIATAERCVEEDCGRVGSALKSHLQRLHGDIVTGPNLDAASVGALFDCPLPNPDMSFHLWTEEVDIWRELAKWLRTSSSSEQFSLNPEHEDSELGDSPGDLMPPDKTRFSVLSNDSGIERDLPHGGDSSPVALIESGSAAASWEPCKSEQESVRLARRGGMKVKPSVKNSVALMQVTMEGDAGVLGDKGGRREVTLQRRAGSHAFLRQQRIFTARIVVMGGDAIMGRLAKAYYCLRKREARRVFLSMKVNLQFYYIPVCVSPTTTSSGKENFQRKHNPCTLGSYLSVVDPWYNCNISSLGCMMAKLAKMQQTNPSRSKEPFVSDVISYYVRMGQQPVNFNIYFVKLTFSSMTKEPVEDVFLTHLEVAVPHLRHASAPMREKSKKSVANLHGALVCVSYKKVTLSGRDTDRGLPMRTTGARVNAIPTSAKEDLNSLTLTLKEWSAKAKNNNGEFKIRSNNIKMCSLETLSSLKVTLDGDCQRIYNDVESIEIIPCLDPGYFVQKNMMSKLKLGDHKDAGLSKYMSKGLGVAVNTFAGFID